MNSIKQIQTVALQGPKGPANAMMIAIDIGDANAAEGFIQQVVEQFKVNRMLAPPDTSMLLITSVGDVSADRFARQWNEITQQDDVVRAFMAQMTVADVIQGTETGKQLSKASLFQPPGREASSRRAWWKFW